MSSSLFLSVVQRDGLAREGCHIELHAAAHKWHDLVARGHLPYENLRTSEASQLKAELPITFDLLDVDYGAALDICRQQEGDWIICGQVLAVVIVAVPKWGWVATRTILPISHAEQCLVDAVGGNISWQKSACGAMVKHVDASAVHKGLETATWTQLEFEAVNGRHRL